MNSILTRLPLPRIPTGLCAIGIIFVWTSCISVAAELDSRSARHQLTRVSDTLYQFSDGEAAGAVLLSEAGAIVIDPMNSQTALWLQAELNNRFSQQVSYVVYSSHLRNRIGGADIFAKNGAQIVAHENTVAFLQNDSSLTPPDIVFSDRLTLRLNTSTVDLHYFGKSVTNNAIAIHFPTEQALYAGSMVAVEALPAIPAETLAAAFMPEWFNTINRLNRIDFVFLLTAQKKIGIQQDGIQHSYFLRELHHRVSLALASGESVTSLKNSLVMDNYSRWRNKDQLPDLIEGMYKLISRD